MLKDGDPIYLVKWESDWAQPQLLHIQSIADVELFGINGRNYGHFVLNSWAAYDQQIRSALALLWAYNIGAKEGGDCSEQDWTISGQMENCSLMKRIKPGKREGYGNMCSIPMATSSNA